MSSEAPVPAPKGPSATTVAAADSMQALLSLSTRTPDAAARQEIGGRTALSEQELVTSPNRDALNADALRLPDQIGSKATARARPQSSHGYTARDRLRMWLAAMHWELVLVLSAQAVLSARLLGANTAFNAEAIYLDVGRLETAHLFHGAAVPAFPTYVSGVPVIYPPIAAMVNALGGLAAARAFSLICVLGATMLLWAVTSRLFGRWAAFFAAGSWAMLGPTLQLGSSATCGAFALLLLTTATWCVLHVGDEHDAASWMFAGGSALALANAVLYPSILFDPVVIALALFGAFPKPGGKRGLTRAGMVVAQTGLLGLLLLKLDGKHYVANLSAVALSLARGDSSVAAPLLFSWVWIGVLAAVASAALALSFFDRLTGGQRAMLLVLGVAAVMAPIEQARLHTSPSLNQYADYGAWFAAIAVGYFGGRLATSLKPRLLRRAMSAGLVGILAMLPVLGARQAIRLTTTWPGAATLAAFLQPRTSHGGRFLADTHSVLEYYLPDTSWRQWSDTVGLTVRSGRLASKPGGATLYINALKHHYFSLVVLSFSSMPGVDREITEVLSSVKGYRLIRKVPFSGTKRGYFTVWAYGGPAGQARE